MTENIFTAEAPSTETSKRPLVLVAGLVGALVLGGGGYFLLSAGSPSASVPVVTRLVPHSAKPAAGKPAAAKPKSSKPLTVLPPASTTPLGRDPFKALYIVPAAVTAPATGGTPATGTPPATGGTTPTGTSTAPSAPVAKTYALKLINVYGAGNNLTGDFSVAGKRQQAKAGSVFGRTQELKLLGLQQGAKGVWTAVVQVGDGQPFDAPAGQTLYVL